MFQLSFQVRDLVSVLICRQVDLCLLLYQKSETQMDTPARNELRFGMAMEQDGGGTPVPTNDTSMELLL